MKKIVKKLNNIFKKGPAPYEAVGLRSGFVILFAVTISGILLAIALGVINIAYKEIRFSTSARDTNNAFFATDTAIEYTLFNDKPPSTVYDPEPGGYKETLFSVPNLGVNNLSCAKVTIIKDNTPPNPNMRTTIIAKGYNLGSSGGVCNPPSNSIERELNIFY